MRLPREVSCIKPDPNTEFKDSSEVLDPEQEAIRRHQRKLGKSNVEAMISKTKGELSAVNRRLK